MRGLAWLVLGGGRGLSQGGQGESLRSLLQHHLSVVTSAELRAILGRKVKREHPASQTRTLRPQRRDKTRSALGPEPASWKPSPLIHTGPSRAVKGTWTWGPGLTLPAPSQGSPSNPHLPISQESLQDHSDLRAPGTLGKGGAVGGWVSVGETGLQPPTQPANLQLREARPSAVSRERGLSGGTARSDEAASDRTRR